MLRSKIRRVTGVNIVSVFLVSFVVSKSVIVIARREVRMKTALENHFFDEVVNRGSFSFDGLEKANCAFDKAMHADATSSVGYCANAVYNLRRLYFCEETDRERD
jgi:hypothetical protein